MGAFKLYIDDKDVTTYIKEGLTEWSQTAERNSIWEFYTDSLDATLDRSFLNIFPGVDTHNAQNIINKKASLEYYGNVIFYGLLTNISYDYYTEEVSVELESNGTIFSNFTAPSGSDVTLSQGSGGDTIYEIADKIVTFTKNQVQAQNLPLYVPGTYVVNLTDFIPLRSFNVTERTTEIVDLVNQYVGTNIPYNVTYTPVDIVSGYRRNNTNSFFILFSQIYDYTEPLPGEPFGDPIYLHVLAKIDENGFNGSDVLWESSIFDIPVFLFEYTEQMVNLSPEIIEVIREYYNNQELEIISQWYTLPFDNNYWFISLEDNEKVITNITLEPDDNLWYKYSDETRIGQITRDVATLINAICWWSVDSELHFVSRDGGIEEITIPEVPANLEYEIESRNIETFEFPEEFSKYINYISLFLIQQFFKEFLDGNFKLYRVTFPASLFTPDMYPLILKRIKVPVESQLLDLGIVKKVNYQEDLIEIETELKL